MRAINRVIVSWVVAGLLAIAAGMTVAKADPPPWAGHDRDDGYRHPDRADRRLDRGHDHYQITTREQIYINDWYRHHAPPGYSRYRGMPPGQAKRLVRGAPWPPPYAYEPLPYELVRGLQPLPPGYRYYRVGADVVIANLAGRVITDVVYDLLNR